MSNYYKTTFWSRWLTGIFMFAPVTSMTSCMIGFMIMDQPKTGLLVWLIEDMILALGLACCPCAEAFRIPWWAKDYAPQSSNLKENKQ